MEGEAGAKELVLFVMQRISANQRVLAVLVRLRAFSRTSDVKAASSASRRDQMAPPRINALRKREQTVRRQKLYPRTRCELRLLSPAPEVAI
jgi:hypothetical protein